MFQKKHKSIKLFSSSLIPIFALLLFDEVGSGLDVRPQNNTCFAENLSPEIVLDDAFPGVAFNQPLVLKQPPTDNSRFMVVEKPGLIQLILNGVKQSTPFLDISSQVASNEERGLLGLAFHPQYTVNNNFYVSYTDLAGNSVISRFTAVNNNQASPSSEQIILQLNQPFSNHNGGQIDFGSDGYLYIGFGDGGSGGDPLNHAQDLSTWLGSMVRIDVNSGSPYSIPADNPFAGDTCNQQNRTGVCPEIYAYGLRNPWRWSFDTLTDNLWLADVGQNQFEEVNLVENGDNLGWRCFEGSNTFNSSGCGTIDAKPPIVEYRHSQGRCSVTGGYVYRGTIESLSEYYLYGDFCTGEIWGLPITDVNSALPVALTNAGGNIFSFAQDNNQNIYVLKSNGEISEIKENPNPNPDPIPTLLSQTGCVNENDISQPANGLIPYDINAPFWSDNATKQRWLALPNGMKIDNSSDDWGFPAGTVLMKNFQFDNQPIETRLFKRHPDGLWAGYSYEWNLTGTEASLVPNGKTKIISTSSGQQLWRYPSSTECLVCHTSAAGYSLGPETAQLNKLFTYPTTGREHNQLETLAAIGVLSHSIGGLQNRAFIANPNDTQLNLTARAKAWLHSNCSSCHRPDGASNSSMDLRYTTALSDMNVCNQEPLNGDWGLNNPKLVLPGDSSRSLIHFRANSRDQAVQMPPLATFISDTVGMNLLEQWINSLTGCN